MTLPLRIGERVIGALDVHSAQAAAFDEDDVQVFQTLADQLAVAIENARLIHALQQNLREIEAVYGRYTQDALERPSSRAPAFRWGIVTGTWTLRRPPSSTRKPTKPCSKAVRLPQPSRPGRDGGEQAQVNAVAIPIKLRNQVIGVLDLRAENQAISPEAISLTEEVADRLAMALENARLFDEARLHAVRERALNQVMARFARSFDVDTVLQTAVRELGQLPRVTEVSVQMGLAEAPSPAKRGWRGRSWRSKLRHPGRNAAGRRSARPTIGFVCEQMSNEYSAGRMEWGPSRGLGAGANLSALSGSTLHYPRGFNVQANVLYDLVSEESVDGLVLWGAQLAHYATLEEVESVLPAFSLFAHRQHRAGAGGHSQPVDG